MEIKTSILKRWVKDYKLPIRIFEEPYFSYYIDLYDPLYHTKEKLEMLKETLTHYATQEDFLSDYYQIRDKAVAYLKENTAWNVFNTGDMCKYATKSLNVSSKDVFKHCHAGKYFISIDLVKANFQALKYADPAIVGNCQSYKEFISMFTTIPYMTESKYMRQVLFGVINPKRQITVEIGRAHV